MPVLVRLRGIWARATCRGRAQSSAVRAQAWVGAASGCPVEGDNREVRELPTGTVTMLFSDIEGSTQLVKALREAGIREVLAEHRRLVRGAIAAPWRP